MDFAHAKDCVTIATKPLVQNDKAGKPDGGSAEYVKIGVFPSGDTR